MEELVQIGGRGKGPRLPGFLRKPQTNYLSVQTLKNELRRNDVEYEIEVKVRPPGRRNTT